jgi:predicted PurR-regulated permease PerM
VSPPASGDRLRPLLVTLLVVCLTFLAWQLADVLLLGFGGVLVAVLLRHLARILSHWTPLSVGASLVFVVLGLILLGVLFVASVGPQVAIQFEQLWQALPHALQSFRNFVARYDWGRDLLATGGQPRAGALLNMASGLLGTVFNAFTDALLVLVVALFLAADPAPYRRGLLRLVPPIRRPRGAEVLDALDDGLWQWILGQSVAMLCVGVITAVGLLLLGIPLAFALGMLGPVRP